MMTKANVGTLDRIVRVVLGLALIAYWWMAGATLGWVALVIGLVFLVTGLVSRCPLYALSGVSTCHVTRT